MIERNPEYMSKFNQISDTVLKYSEMIYFMVLCHRSGFSGLTNWRVEDDQSGLSNENLAFEKQTNTQSQKKKNVEL